MKSGSETIAVIGLGYVGLAIAVALAERYERVVGFDTDPSRVAALRRGHDRTGEVEPDRLAASGLRVTGDAGDMAGCTFFIVAVPTPLDALNRPDLGALESACQALAPWLSAGAAVVFESTVYPGVTEDICAPLLERHSGLRRGTDFFIGYSPERINPGDREHRLDCVVKIIAAENAETLARLRAVYGSAVTAGLHEAPSIRVAEAAKMLENVQRYINVAIMNEFAFIFDKMGIRTQDVIEAAQTKWNFLPFHPGIVGGHCVGIDPYYMIHASEALGYRPRVLLSGIDINNEVAALIARKTLSMVAAKSRPRIGVLGITFKENVPDLRNSKTPFIVRDLEAGGAEVIVYDPHASRDEAQREYRITLSDADDLTDLDAIVFAVPHSQFREWAGGLQNRLNEGAAVIDVRSSVDPGRLPPGIAYWSL